MKKNHIIILLVLFLYSCSPDYKAQPNIQSEKKLRKTSLLEKRLPVNDLTLDYLYKTFIYEDSKDTYLFSLNDQEFGLDVFDLKKSNFKNHIKLFLNGSESVGEVYDYYVHNLDSIFLIGPYQVSLINYEGVLLKKMKINISEATDKHIYSSGSLGEHRIFYFEENLYSRLSYQINREEKGYYMGPIEVKISLNTEANQAVDIYYSSLYQDGTDYFGFLSYPNCTFFKGKLIYNFPAEPNVYVYNLNNKEQSIYGGKSKYFNTPVAQSLLRSEFDGSRLLEHWVKNPAYLEIIPDKYKNLYYRIQAHPISYLNIENEPNTWLDKEFSLTIFDQKFQIIDEIKLDNRIYYPKEAFVTSEGIWISKETSNNVNNEEGVIEYDVFSFDVQ